MRTYAAPRSAIPITAASGIIVLIAISPVEGDEGVVFASPVVLPELLPLSADNGRSTRIWLDLILKKELGQVVDWSLVDKEDYLLAMERSPIRDIEIKHLLRQALTDQIDDREVYMKGIDISYYYEGYIVYKTEEL